MRVKTQSGKVVSSHSSACGASSLGAKRADRLAQLLVLVGEDEVLAPGAEVGLEDVGGGGRESTARAATEDSDGATVPK